MTDLCTVRQRGGASAPITFIAMPTRRCSQRSAPAVIFWTRVDHLPRADEMGQHEFGEPHGPAEQHESSTATGAGPAEMKSGSRGPLVVTASAVPDHSTHVMVRARVAAQPASRGPAATGVDGWDCPLCRRFLSPTSRPVNGQHLRSSRARKGRSCARNLPTPQRSTTTTPTFLLQSNRGKPEAPTVGRANSLGRASAWAVPDATWWCAAFAAIRRTCASSRGWWPASRHPCWRRKPVSNPCAPNRTPPLPALAMTAMRRSPSTFALVPRAQRI